MSGGEKVMFKLLREEPWNEVISGMDDEWKGMRELVCKFAEEVKFMGLDNGRE